MTEDEATSKRCCGPEGCGGNLLDAYSGTTGRHCIGSVCMAWREEYAIWDKNRDQWQQPENPLKDFEHRKTGSGFCGLAGKP